ncbi:MAG: ATP-binding cassette domain-containing protein [Bacteroidaceae bacterium]|nr:ATP-binding cassette domain-containing protein [Bacteroidaceae bacterium]
MSELLKINDLRGGYTEGFDILRGISIEMQHGEAVGIIGLNGSGKSTFGKAIMNMIPIRKGELFFKGENVTNLSTSQLAHRGISIMQQGGKVFPNLSVWENIQLAMNDSPSSSYCHSSIQDIVPLLSSPKHELQRIMADKLSGGQKHQLSLAMTLSIKPSLVILDEPSAGLSPKAVEEMYQILRNVREQLNVSIILIEQNISKALEFCDRSLLIEQGAISNKFKNNDLSEINYIMFNY